MMKAITLLIKINKIRKIVKLLVVILLITLNKNFIKKYNLNVKMLMDNSNINKCIINN